MNLTGESDDAWVAVGIAETVTGDLRALGTLRVVERWRVVEAARRTDGTAPQIAGALGVKLVLVGSFQRMAVRFGLLPESSTRAW